MASPGASDHGRQYADDIESGDLDPATPSVSRPSRMLVGAPTPSLSAFVLGPSLVTPGSFQVKDETLHRVEAIQSLTIVNVQPVAAEAPINEDAVLSKITWRLLPYIAWLYMLCFLDRINLSNVHGSILSDLGMSETDYATAVGVFFIGYITCELPSNLVLSVVQPRIWIARILITWGGITCCFAACSSKAGLIVCRLFLGMAEAGFFPGMVHCLVCMYVTSTCAVAFLGSC